MIEQILREHLARSLASYLLGPQHLDAMIRPTLERLGLDRSEIDDIIRQAEENLRAWGADGPNDAERSAEQRSTANVTRANPNTAAPNRDSDPTAE